MFSNGYILIKRLLLNVISILFIMILSIGITGCSTQNKVDSDINHSSISKPEVTSVPNTSPIPTTVVPNQLSSPQSGHKNAEIDYEQYIKKVWVVNTGANDFITYPSFSISKIVNGQITGKFNLTLGIPNNISNYGRLTGTISKNTAVCQFDDEFGVKGTIKLVFKTNDKIEATIEYSDKSQADKFKAKAGTPYEYIPLNINSMYGFVPIESQSFIVDLNSWGNVKFVSGKDMGEKTIPIKFYLTDKDGHIYYEFYVSPNTNVDIAAVSFQDVNKDGLKDIIIILNDKNPEAGYKKEIATILLQNADGSFTNDSKLDQEINDSGNNKEIKTIMDYLSKKF